MSLHRQPCSSLPTRVGSSLELTCQWMVAPPPGKVRSCVPLAKLSDLPPGRLLGQDRNRRLVNTASLERTKGSLSMSQKTISSGVVHPVPADLKKALTSDPKVLTAWEDITPLARNEWICWIESAKKAETRSRRIEWGCSSLKDGKRRPCCWPGCSHR